MSPQCTSFVTIRSEGKEGSFVSPCHHSAPHLLPLDVRARKEALCHYVTTAQCILTVAIRCEGKEGCFVSPWLSASCLLPLDVRARTEALCHHVTTAQCILPVTLDERARKEAIIV